MNTPNASSNPDLKSYMNKLDDTLELYLVKKSPVTLPENIKEIIVKIAPYVTIVGVILGVLAVLFILGITPFLMFVGGGYGGNILSALVLGVSVVFEALSIPGLMNKTQAGWRYAYYGVLFGIVSNIFSFNLFGAIIGGLIGLFILFQVRNMYK